MLASLIGGDRSNTTMLCALADRIILHQKWMFSYAIVQVPILAPGGIKITSIIFEINGTNDFSRNKTFSSRISCLINPEIQKRVPRHTVQCRHRILHCITRNKHTM